MEYRKPPPNVTPFELAMLLKKSGYSVGCQKSFVHYHGDFHYDGDPNHPESHSTNDIQYDGDFYVVNNTDYGDESNEHYTLYGAPTLSEVREWLEETHGIEVFVIPIFREKCGYDSFRRAGFGYEVLTTEPCQYLDWAHFMQCAEEIEEHLAENDEDEQVLRKPSNTYNEAFTLGLISGVKQIKTKDNEKKTN